MHTRYRKTILALSQVHTRMKTQQLSARLSRDFAPTSQKIYIHKDLLIERLHDRASKSRIGEHC